MQEALLAALPQLCASADEAIGRVACSRRLQMAEVAAACSPLHRLLGLA